MAWGSLAKIAITGRGHLIKTVMTIVACIPMILWQISWKDTDHIHWNASPGWKTRSLGHFRWVSNNPYHRILLPESYSSPPLHSWDPTTNKHTYLKCKDWARTQLEVGTRSPLNLLSIKYIDWILFSPLGGLLFLIVSSVNTVKISLALCHCCPNSRSHSIVLQITSNI